MRHGKTFLYIQNKLYILDTKICCRHKVIPFKCFFCIFPMLLVHVWHNHSAEIVPRWQRLTFLKSMDHHLETLSP